MRDNTLLPESQLGPAHAIDPLGDRYLSVLAVLDVTAVDAGPVASAPGRPVSIGSRPGWSALQRAWSGVGLPFVAHRWAIGYGLSWRLYLRRLFSAWLCSPGDFGAGKRLDLGRRRVEVVDNGLQALDARR
jgi:hypothetical protein